MLSKAAALIYFLLSPILSFGFHEIVVVDQHDTPIEDAVIFAGGAINATNEEVAVMDQVNKAFTPRVLTISVGQAVEFPNSDDIRHHVYSFSKAKTFEIKLYKGKPSSPVRFDKPGIVVLGCNIHDSMVGYIIVSDTENWAQTDQEGKARIDVKGVQELKVWHPRLNLEANKLEVVSLLPSEKPQIIRLTLVSPEPQKPSFSTNRFKRYAR